MFLILNLIRRVPEPLQPIFYVLLLAFIFGFMVCAGFAIIDGIMKPIDSLVTYFVFHQQQ